MPQGDQPLLLRVCHALDLHPHELAKALGMKQGEVKSLITLQVQEHDMDGELWTGIEKYVNDQLAYLMAVKLDMQRVMQKHRAKQALRTATLLSRDKRSGMR